MLNLIKTNPGLLIITIILVMAVVICGFMVVLFRQQGASVRPLVWFMGFMLLVAGPQLAFHLRSAVKLSRIAQPRENALRTLMQDREAVSAASRSVAAKTLFGRDADPDLVQDARRIFGDAMANAQAAQFAALPDGATALIAMFDGASAAEKAWVEYLRVAGLTQTTKGDSRRGCVATRPMGDRLYALPEGRMLAVWTAADDAAIIHRVQAAGFTLPSGAPLDSTSVTQSIARSGFSPAVIVPVLAAYLLLVALYFFKGAAWAGSVPAKSDVQPVAMDELRSRLESINALDVPFTIEPGEGADQLIATWRYADAKWVDLARAHGMRRTHKIVLTLDSDGSVARVTDHAANFDWSAGADGANIAWKSELGITFFHVQRGRVFGLQLDERGRPKPELSYAYAFNLNEMKQPLTDVVTAAGWTWRPTIWQGPKWLRWMTE